jgi:hypothetical protein
MGQKILDASFVSCFYYFLFNEVKKKLIKRRVQREHDRHTYVCTCACKFGSWLLDCQVKVMNTYSVQEML